MKLIILLIFDALCCQMFRISCRSFAFSLKFRRFCADRNNIFIQKDSLFVGNNSDSECRFRKRMNSKRIAFNQVTLYSQKYSFARV